VAEHPLECVDIAAVAEEVDGEGVAEAVGMSVEDASALAESMNELVEARGGERAFLLGQEEGISGDGIGAGDQVAPGGFEGLVTDGEEAFFIAFAKDRDLEIALVQMLDAQAGSLAAGIGGQLGGAEASISEQEDDGAIAAGGGAGVGTFALARPDVGLGAVAGGEHRFDILARIGVDGTLLELGAIYGADDVVGGEVFFDGPGPERAEGDVMVVDSLVGEGAGRAGDGAVGGDGCGGEVLEEAADVVGGDFGQGDVAEIVLEAVEDLEVGSDGARAEAAGVGIEEVALDGLG